MDIATSNLRENEQRVAEEYLSSLSDLNCNSKPLINMLTMLAEENIEYAAVIVKVVEQHIAKVSPEIKLPILYLIDSIVKNVKSSYVQLFSQCIVNIFCGVFEKVNERIRERMYALRQTWNEVFSAQKLYALDVKIKRLDNNWPITAKQPAIHVNPNFLKTVNSAQTMPTEMEKILQDKTRELLELKKRKLELELEATKKHLEQQEKQICKTAEGVMPPVEALVAANALQTVGMPPQMMPTIMPPGYMAGPQNIAVNPAMRPAMFHPHMRAFRPNLHPNMMNVPPLQGMPPSLMHPNSNMGPNTNKPKVHPVNSALLNSVRQRDPRLMRQQQQQQQLQQQEQNIDRNTGQHNIRSLHSNKEKEERNHKSSHKSSPTKTSTSTSSSSRSSSSRSSKSSQRDKERDRKRSESKSSSTSSSSAGSSAAIKERRKSFSSFGKSPDKNSSSKLSSSKCDKDAFEIAPLSTAFKRKSSSPGSSPSKSRDSKRSNSHKSHTSTRSKTRSRSRSPDGNINSTAPYKDIDLRRTSTSSTTSLMIASPDKRAKISDSDHETNKEDLLKTVVVATNTASSDKDIDKTSPITKPVIGLMDIDLRPHLVVATSSGSTAASTAHAKAFTSSSFDKESLDLNSKFTSTTNLMTTTNPNFFRNIDEDNIILSTKSAKNIVATSSPKVSFKIQKIFNKLEKSTENILSSASVTTTGSSSRMNSDTLMDSNDNSVIKTDESGGHVSKDPDDDGKKRSLAPIKDEEPLAKKSKSTKLDALFGSEDVDLRQLIPPVIAATSSSQQEEEAAPPPPPIKIASETSRESNENWDNLKTESNKNSMVKSKSSLEDVRAKLAKTAKLNKLSKLDKLNKDIDHRNKLAELHMNEDTQEANDEKIRTMITQAQELLESNSINQEQYKNLVKTVMSINETNKLQEAKRRESLNANKQKYNDDGSTNNESTTVRNAAKQAVLKKRIPKLNKNQTVNEQPADMESQQSEGGNAEDSPQTEDKNDSNDEPINSRSNRNTREKRGPKVSKWGDRVVEAGPGAMIPTGPTGQQQRPWNAMVGPNKRGGFRGNGPQNIRPPWNMGPGGPGNGPAPPPPQFRGILPMGGLMIGNILPPPIGPIQPPVIPKPCNSIDNPQEDLVRTITIDGTVKEIRFYDQVAIVFMEADQPREIGFQNGQRNISIDNNEPIALQFNEDYKSVNIDGEVYKLRFGFPSRELYIDENWYEIYFGGPPIGVPIRNKMHMLKAEGPPPQVNIGPLRRDLVVGKINMIVDAHNLIPLFLDARLQTFRLGDKEHTIQFADNLLTVLLDGAPTRVEYGGLPKSLFLGGKKYFVRFGALPQGVVAGKVQIKDMLYVETKPPPVVKVDIPESATTEGLLAPPINEVNQVELQNTTTQSPSVPIIPAAAVSKLNIDELLQKLVSTGILGGSSGVTLPSVTNSSQSTATSVKTNEIVKPAIASSESNSAEEIPPPAPSAQLELIKPIDLSKPESIKTRQSAIVATLFTGMQCSSCGVRFPPEQTIKYSQHLDWHFRQNRRERDTSRKAHARKWYYDLNDWVQYEEIEDMEERENNFFESQQNNVETIDESSNQRSTNSPIPSCPAGADDVDRACDMCQEKFEQYYNNEQEEWHLRCAVRVEDKIYHPLCYEDYKASLNPPPKPIDEEETSSADNKEISLIQIDDDNAVDIVIKVEEDDDDDDVKVDDKNSTSVKIIDDDDDDVIVLPNEEPSVTEIVDDDDDEYIPANVTREQMGNAEVEEDGHGDLNETTESDVEIQEPNIPFTDLDTYVEKELPEGDETSQLSFMNVKIKEEPNADDDEDDGFEEVGTVVIAPDEISIHSSEDTQTQTIDSSVNSAMSPIPERPSSTTPSLHNEENEPTVEPPAVDLNISMDGNMETGDEHNLSAAGPAPNVPLASLVNKIKINITKNSVTTSNNTNSSNNTLSSASNSTKSSKSDSLGHSGVTSNPIPTISTIPVLCGGGTTMSSISSSIPTSGGGGGVGGYEDHNDHSVSTISVIGSYGSSAPTITHINRPVNITVPTPAPKPATPPPQPIEETITYEIKPALQKASLRKKEKVVCGNETSGLCSIM